MVIQTAGSRHGILRIHIKSPAVLHEAYMPFLRNGGLFFPTEQHYEIGDQVFLLLHLLDEASPIPVTGKVDWITPPRAQGNKVAGIGIHFSDGDNQARARIEACLGSLLSAGKPTQTM